MSDFEPVVMSWRVRTDLMERATERRIATIVGLHDLRTNRGENWRICDLERTLRMWDELPSNLDAVTCRPIGEGPTPLSVESPNEGADPT